MLTKTALDKLEDHMQKRKKFQTEYEQGSITDEDFKAMLFEWQEQAEMLRKGTTTGETTPITHHFEAVEPPHYHRNQIDVINFLMMHFPFEPTVTVAQGFFMGNVIKYVCRFQDKNGIEDLYKAQRYLEKLIETIKED